MRRFLPVWVVWLILEVVSLRATVALLPVAASSPSSFGTIFVFTICDTNRSNPLLKEPASASQELNLLCEQESKHVSALTHFCDLCLTAQQRNTCLQLVSTRDLPSPLFFSPRQLSPPSADDDPFLH